MEYQGLILIVGWGVILLVMASIWFIRELSRSDELEKLYREILGEDDDACS